MSYEVTWDHIFDEFKTMMPFIKNDIMDWYPSGQMEITAKLENGSKVVYDYISKTSKFILDPDEHDEWSEENYKDNFSRRLRRRLRLRGMTQDELSRAVDISRQTLSSYMNGRSVPSAYQVAKIARALQCSVSELIDFV